MLRQLQICANKTPLALLVDMKVCWSSMYVMLKQGTQLEAVCNEHFLITVTDECNSFLMISSMRWAERSLTSPSITKLIL